MLLLQAHEHLFRIVPPFRRWKSNNNRDDKSTLVQAMAWGVRQQAIDWANVNHISVGE